MKAFQVISTGYYEGDWYAFNVTVATYRTNGFAQAHLVAARKYDDRFFKKFDRLKARLGHPVAVSSPDYDEWDAFRQSYNNPYNPYTTYIYSGYSDVHELSIVEIEISDKLVKFRKNRKTK